MKDHAMASSSEPSSHNAAAPEMGENGVDPLSLMPLPDPSAAGFTIDQLWPRQDAPASKVKPDWLVGLSQKPMS
jgi:hypothetical protein